MGLAPPPPVPLLSLTSCSLTSISHAPGGTSTAGEQLKNPCGCNRRKNIYQHGSTPHQNNANCYTKLNNTCRYIYIYIKRTEIVMNNMITFDLNQCSKTLKKKTYTVVAWPIARTWDGFVELSMHFKIRYHNTVSRILRQAYNVPSIRKTE